MGQVGVLVAALLVVFAFSCIDASHFRYGTISWRVPDATTPWKVLFSYSYGWRRDFFVPAAEVGVNITASIAQNKAGPNVPTLTILNYPNMTEVFSTQIVCTFISSDPVTNSAYCQGEYLYNFSIPTPTTQRNYTAGYMNDPGARLQDLLNNANAKPWNVSTLVTLNSYVTKANGDRVLNSAPVSSNLPIVPVYANESNVFRVIGLDDETPSSSLSYYLATGIDLGGTTQKPPPNFTVSSNGTVVFNTLGLATGLWTAQVRISDGLSYSVVDFILENMARPRICNLTCTNVGQSCTSDSTCTGCTGGSSRQCVVGVPPSIVYPPTPDDGDQFVIYPGFESTWTIMAKTYNQGANVTLTYNNPPGSKVTTTLFNGTTTSTIKWTPTAAQAGSYVVTIGCYDSNKMQCTGQSSFSITVMRPFCGHSGTITPPSCNPTYQNCSCSCAAEGYDASQLCYQCLPGYYGSGCTQCTISCYNEGVCNDGISNDGLCRCTADWWGDNCSVPVVRPCSSDTPSLCIQISQTSSSESYLKPTFVSAYIASNPALAALRVGVNVSIPVTPIRLDVLVLFDRTSTVNSDMLGVIHNLTQTKRLLNDIRTMVPGSYFGLASFTRGGCTPNDYDYRLDLSLSPNIQDFLDTVSSSLVSESIGCSSATPSYPLQDGSATSGGVGWRSETYHMVILVTDSADPLAPALDDARNALLGFNIVPIFVSPASSYYTTVTDSFQFGLSSTISSDYSDLLSQSLISVKAALGSVWTVVDTSSDKYGFAKSVSAAQTGLVAPANISTYVEVKYPTTNPIFQTSSFTLNQMGWGSTTISTVVNRIPVPNYCSASTTATNGVLVPVTATDADGNGMLILVESLPKMGKLFVSNASQIPVVEQTTYNLPDGLNGNPYFYYQPESLSTDTDTFKFRVSDGCAESASVVCYIKLNYDDQLPVAVPATVTTTKNTPVTIQLNGTDDTTALNSLGVMVVSLPDPARGTLYHVNRTLVKAGTTLSASDQRSVVFVPVNYTCCVLASFSFVVIDSRAQQSSPATLVVDVLDSNTAPQLLYSSSVTVERFYPYGISLRVKDYDVADNETIVILGYEAGLGGSFSDANGNAFGQAPFDLTTVQVGSNGEATIFVFYTAPKNFAYADYARLTVVVKDAAGASSETGIITINIKATNQIPVTTPVAPVTVLEKHSSETFSLYGDDGDNGDASSLTVVITSLPVKGTLVRVGGGNITGTTPIVISYLQSHEFYYQASWKNKDDTLTFFVIDNLGAMGNNVTVSFYVTPVNDPPQAFLSSFTTDEDTEVVVEIETFDLDGDRVYIIIDSLPLGTLYQFDGTVIDSVPTELNINKFKYLPPRDANEIPYSSFTFHADDKNTEHNLSPNYTVVINVNPVNDAPTAEGGKAEITENDPPAQFSLPISDVDSSDLSAIILTLPDSSLGYLQDLHGASLQVGQFIYDPHTIQFQPNPYSHGSISFTFLAFDGLLNSTSAATFEITVIHKNHVPVINADSPVATNQSVAVEISFVVLEHDKGDTITLVFYDVEPGVNGSFSFMDIPSTVVSNGSSLVFTAVYAPPLFLHGDNYAKFSVNVTDQDSAWSLVTVVVNVGERGNVDPIASALVISATQDFTTDSFSLYGSDADSIDENALVFVIDSLPSHGSLFSNGEMINYFPFDIDASNNNLTYLSYVRNEDAFSFYAVDTVGAKSSKGTVTITILPTNHNPSLSLPSSTISADEDATNVTINGFLVDPDVGDVLSVWLEDLPANGTLTQADGTPITTAPTLISDADLRILFTPDPDAFGIPYTSFNVSARDNKGGVSPNAKITVYVNPVNDAPVAVGGNVEVPENSAPIQFSLYATDIDTDATSLTIIISTLPDPILGALQTTSGELISIDDVINYPWELVFAPIADQYGLTSFLFFANDGQLNSDPVNQTIEVGFVNSLPVAYTLPLVTASRGVSIALNLSVSDTDVPEHFTFNVTSHKGGSFVLASGAVFPNGPFTLAKNVPKDSPYVLVTFIAPVDAVGKDYASLSFVVVDSHGGVSEEAHVQIDIQPNTAPQAVQLDTIQLNEESNSSVFYLYGTDVDYVDNSSLVVVIKSLPSLSVLHSVSNDEIAAGSVIQDSAFYLTGNALSYGEDSFEFQVKDLAGSLSLPSTVKIRITHVNHAPSSFFAPEVVALRTVPLVINLGVEDVDTPEEFIFNVTSFHAGNGVFQSNEGTAFKDNTPFTLASGVEKAGDLTVATISFIAPANANGTNYASLSYIVLDSHGESTKIATIFINIAPNNPPVASLLSSITFDEESTSIAFFLEGTDEDVGDEDSLNVVITELPDKATLLADGEEVEIGKKYSKGIDFTLAGRALQHGIDSFSFVVEDILGAQSVPVVVDICITHVNHAPTTLSFTVTGDVNSIIAISLSGQDPDGDVVSIYLTQLPSQGSIQQWSNESITSASESSPVLITGSLLYFVPPYGQIGSPLASFNFYVSDSNLTSYATVSINVLAVNRPVAHPVLITIAQDTVATINLDAVDPDSVEIAYYSLINLSPNNGSFLFVNGTEISGNEITLSTPTIQFVPTAGTYGLDVLYASFSYSVSNVAGLDSDLETVSIYVYRTVFPKPIFTGNTSFSTNEDQSIQIPLLASSEASNYSFICVASGPGGINLDNTIITLPSTLPKDAVLTWTPPSSEFGDALGWITVLVVDKFGGQSDPINITIDVVHVNSPPVVSFISYSIDGEVYQSQNMVIPENKKALLVFAVNDVDSADLTLLISNPPSKGNMYQYQSNSNSEDVGTPITFVNSDRYISAGVDGLYRCYFVPASGEYGRNYSSFSVKAYDGKQTNGYLGVYESQGVTIEIRVKHDNIAPTITISELYWHTLVAGDGPLNITGVMVDDKDASKENVFGSIRLDAPEGSVVSWILPESNASSCLVSSTEVNCTVPIATLSAIFAEILFYVSQQQKENNTYTLSFFVSDLGAGDDGSENALTATANLYILATQTPLVSTTGVLVGTGPIGWQPPSNLPTTSGSSLDSNSADSSSSNDSPTQELGGSANGKSSGLGAGAIAGIAIGSTAGAAALLFSGFRALNKNPNNPLTRIASSFGSSGAGLNHNPLYAQQPEKINPLYQNSV